MIVFCVPSYLKFIKFKILFLFENCTTLVGDFIIDFISVTGDYKYTCINTYKNKDYCDDCQFEILFRPLFKSDLKAFHKVKTITGGININSSTWIIGSTSLGDAFPNLEKIERRPSSARNWFFNFKNVVHILEKNNYTEFPLIVIIEKNLQLCFIFVSTELTWV